jgi:hypothetical protein
MLFHYHHGSPRGVDPPENHHLPSKGMSGIRYCSDIKNTIDIRHLPVFLVYAALDRVFSLSKVGK